MKLAVLKLGARLTYSDSNTSGGTGEAINIIRMLITSGAEVHAYTKVLAKDPKPPIGVTLLNIETTEFDSTNYDALIVINGNVNFFGGAEDKSQILNYKIINNFKGKVFYIYCDPNLQLKQIWSSVEKKPWGSKWKQSDIEITRKDIRVISQSKNLKMVNELFSKAGIEVSNYYHYEFEKFPMMWDSIESEPIVDIMYGGTFRAGRRENSLAKFYFGYPDDILVEVFGKIKLEDFNSKNISGLKPPLFTGPVNYNDMLNKMTNSLSHIVIGDNHYPKIGMISQRTYESVQAGCITFIDSEFDTSQRVFGSNVELSKLLYVKSTDDVIKRIRDIKKLNYRSEIIEAQKKAINFDAKYYCDGLIDLIKE